MHTLSPEIARRFVLGKQGLWPGRRWRGARGTEHAMRASEHLQLDPLIVVARSHDITLHSRVIGYQPDDWAKPTYQQRKFFDWGGWLAVRPMEELPHWRVVMRRDRAHPGWQRVAAEHAEAIAEMRQVLRDRETVANRDFEMHTRKRINSYRGRKDSALALHYLWRIGEAMMHHRERFERVYALAERVAPAHLLAESSDIEADDFLAKKLIAFHGLMQLGAANGGLNHLRPMQKSEVARWTQRKIEDGELIEVSVEGWKGAQLALSSDAPLLRELEAGRVPKAWRPLDTTTTDEVTFLAPLDIVSARGRAKVLFDFEYKWEVYTPAPQRKFGYYALPILWGDSLVARADLKLDRSSNMLMILGFWLEESHKMLGKNAAFAHALARGVSRFMRFVGAENLDAKAIKPVALRAEVMKVKD